MHWFPSGLRRIEMAVGDADSLEVGCGNRSPIQWFSRQVPRRTGVDLFGPSIEQSRAAGIHTEYVQADVLSLDEHFMPGSVDVVIALDLIEHLTPDDGVKLLALMERLAAKRVVVYTPNGFLEQGEYGGNPWQRHHSGWTVPQFESSGYQVAGLNGLKWLRGEYATPRLKPLALGNLVSALTQPIVYRRPRLAFALLAVKDVSADRQARLGVAPGTDSVASRAAGGSPIDA